MALDSGKLCRVDTKVSNESLKIETEERCESVKANRVVRDAITRP